MKKDRIRMNGQRIDQVIEFVREASHGAVTLEAKLELQRLVKTFEAARSEFRRATYTLEDAIGEGVRVG